MFRTELSSGLLVPILFLLALLSPANAQTPNALSVRRSGGPTDTVARSVQKPLAKTNLSASSKIRSMIDSDPNNWELYHALGIEYGKEGSFDKAREALETAVKLNADSASTFLNLGIIYDHLQRFDDARTAVQRSIELDPTNILANREMCEVTLLSNKFQDANSCYEHLLAMAPADAASYGHYVFGLLAVGDLKNAERVAGEARKLFPASSDPLNSLGMVAFRRSDYDKAASMFKKALELDPASAFARFNLAITDLRANDRGGALTEYNTIKNSDPKLATKLYQILYGRWMINAQDPDGLQN